MTKTYSERRQATYFRAASDLYRLVVEIADENIDNPPEGRENVSQANITWAASLVESTFAKAKSLEQLGHDECVASPRAERSLARQRFAAEAKTAAGRDLKRRILENLK